MSDKEQEYCLTEIPDLGNIGQYTEDVEFTTEFWKMVAEYMRKEHERYVK